MTRFMLGLLVFASAAVAVAPIPPMKFTPLGKPDAPVTGTFNRNAGAEPESLNPMHISELVSQHICEYVVEGLLFQNPDTLEWQPQLAENYEVSKDSLTYTFYLRKN